MIKPKNIFLFFVALSPLVGHSKESVAFSNIVAKEHHLNLQQTKNLTAILTTTHLLTRNIETEDQSTLQGPHDSWHPASRQECRRKVIDSGLIKSNTQFESICKAKWMAPIPENKGASITNAHTCIDQFEFPNIPCEYPVVWATSQDANKICQSMGKRICNSHEWEGGCAGYIEKSPYNFETSDIQKQRFLHNSKRETVWAYQWNQKAITLNKTNSICGVFSATDPEISLPMKDNTTKYYTNLGKSLNCQKTNSDFVSCGTNSWPSGFKYECRSTLDVFDLHGNIAEVVNLPNSPNQFAKDSVDQFGGTEHKGSFFVKRTTYPDDCRVRQPYEHFQPFKLGTMAYYQEGFRCCKDIE